MIRPKLKFFSITRTIFSHSRSKNFWNRIHFSRTIFRKLLKKAVGWLKKFSKNESISKIVLEALLEDFLRKVCGSKDFGVDVVGSVIFILLFVHPFVPLGM